MYKTTLCILWLCGGFALAQSDRLSVAFSDPSRPGTVKASLVQGGITVKAYNGKEVIVEARTHGSQREPERKDGLRRIPMNSSGLSAEEENNVMNVSAASHAQPVDLSIQVPVKTSLKLSSIHGGNIVVEGVQGEIEVSDINGSVTLTNVAGSAVVHALNGKIQANFTQVEAKPMSFSSLNGAIDVTFPADLKANVKIKSDRGEVYTDYEIAMKASPQQPVVEDSRKKTGRYQVRMDKAVYGAINGGGPEIQFSNFNGAIYIRKGK